MIARDIALQEQQQDVDRRIRELREEMERFEKMKIQNSPRLDQHVPPASTDATRSEYADQMDEEGEITFTAPDDQSTPVNSEMAENSGSNDNDSSSSSSSSGSGTNSSESESKDSDQDSKQSSKTQKDTTTTASTIADGASPPSLLLSPNGYPPLSPPRPQPQKQEPKLPADTEHSPEQTNPSPIPSPGSLDPKLTATYDTKESSQKDPSTIHQNPPATEPQKSLELPHALYPPPSPNRPAATSSAPSLPTTKPTHHLKRESGFFRI